MTSSNRCAPTADVPTGGERSGAVHARRVITPQLDQSQPCTIPGLAPLPAQLGPTCLSGLSKSVKQDVPAPPVEPQQMLTTRGPALVRYKGS